MVNTIAVYGTTAANAIYEARSLVGNAPAVTVKRLDGDEWIATITTKPWNGKVAYI